MVILEPRPRILIINISGTPDVASLGSYLSRQGAAVEYVASDEAAAEAIRNRVYDAVVVESEESSVRVDCLQSLPRSPKPLVLLITRDALARAGLGSELIDACMAQGWLDSKKMANVVYQAAEVISAHHRPEH